MVQSRSSNEKIIKHNLGAQRIQLRFLKVPEMTKTDSNLPTAFATVLWYNEIHI